MMGLGSMFTKSVEAGKQDNEVAAEAARKRKKEQMNKNPFLKYGVGILNFFKLQRELVKLLFGISILAILQIVIFRSHGALSYLEDEKGYTFANLSFASMGFATNNCGKSTIDWE